MTPKAQRIAIALARGWKMEDLLEDDGRFGQLKSSLLIDPEGVCRSINGRGVTIEMVADHLPDYLNDLNEIHEVLFGLNFEDLCRVSDHLEAIMDPELKRGSDAWWVPMIRASAGDLARSYLMAIGKWDDTK